MNGNGGLSRGLSTYTELLACLAFARRGYEIAVPLPVGIAQKGWDMLVKFDGEGYQRVQVKAARVKHGRVLVKTCKQQLRRSTYTDVKIPYEGHEFDLLLAVEPDSGVMWLVPMSEVCGRTGVLLSGRVPWVGERELPTLHEITTLSRILRPREVPEQTLLALDAPGREIK
jgi:hypothetical protein